MEALQHHIEALIFCSPHPAQITDIKSCLSELLDADPTEQDIEAAIESLEKKYRDKDFSFQLYKSGGGYQFMTKPAYQSGIALMLKQLSKKRLSTAALETLAIIAYKHPVSKSGIENIRGVNCDYTLRKLLEKGLIRITGKADTVGRPLLYGVSPFFMEYFGLDTLDALPTPKDFAPEENTLGEVSEN